MLTIYNFFVFLSENLDEGLSADDRLNNSMQDIWQLIVIIVAFIIVAILAYVSTKLVGGAKITGRRSGNIDIVESRGISVNSAVQLIRVGSKLYLIGVTKEKITFLTEIDSNDINLNDKPVNQISAAPFAQVLSKYIKMPTKMQSQQEQSQDDITDNSNIDNKKDEL